MNDALIQSEYCIHDVHHQYVCTFGIKFMNSIVQNKKRQTTIKTHPLVVKINMLCANYKFWVENYWLFGAFGHSMKINTF